MRRNALLLVRGNLHNLNYTRQHKRLSSTKASAPPLFQLRNAIFPSLHPSSSPLSLTINDHSSEMWAVIAPHSSSSSGSKLLDRLLSTLSSQSRPQQQQKNIDEDTSMRIHPSPHLFTKNTKLVALASFAKKQVTSNAEFQDFSARYGALREEDTVTVFESLMDAQGFEVGKIAAMKVVPDKLQAIDVDPSVQIKAAAAKSRIEKLAPLLGLHKPGPGSEGGVPLLYSPVISLSNGQLRRARIVSSLVRLDEASSNEEGILQKSLLILDQPYSGLDESSRSELTTLLGQLHGSGKPRVILVLRRQDDLPAAVTHIIDVDTQGKVWIGNRSEWSGANTMLPSGMEGIRRNSRKGVGVGRGDELARLSDISVRYGDKVVLDSINLTLRKGSRLIIKGANGSGKTTLLSLLSGTHPQSYSFSLDNYALFGKSRSTPSNASRLLSQKIGYFGPDLLASFPRKGREMGGLSVKDAVACGFTGVFSRVSLKSEQRKRVEQLLNLFQDCLSFRGSGARVKNSITDWWERDFIQLDGGSQAVVLFLRAVVNRPAILILDEPFQGMDAVQIDLIRLFIELLGKKEDTRFVMGETPKDRNVDVERAADCAVVLVSHYINEWPEGMGEFLLLDNGRIVDYI